MSLQINLTSPENLEYLLEMDFQPLIPLLINGTCSLVIPQNLDMIPQNILEKFAEKIARVQSQIPFFIPNISILFQVMEDSKIEELLTLERAMDMSYSEIYMTFKDLQSQNKNRAAKKMWGLYEKLDDFPSRLCGKLSNGIINSIRLCEYNPIEKELNMNEFQKFIADKFQNFILYVKAPKPSNVAYITNKRHFQNILSLSENFSYWKAHLDLLGIKQTFIDIGVHTNKNNILKNSRLHPEEGYDVGWKFELPNKEIVQDFLLALDNMILHIQHNINK